MKKIIAVIMLSLLLSLACEKANYPVNVPGYPDKILLSGQVVEIQYGYSGYEKIVPVSNVEVEALALDKKGTTDINGQFEMILPRADSVRLQIKKPLYLSFEQTVFFETDTTAVFEIVPIRADFFPLAVGNYWNYDYESYFSPPGGAEVTRRVGTQSWQITGMSWGGEYTKYQVLTILNATQYYRQGGWDGTFMYDTTFVQNDSSYFIISEDDENWLDVKYRQIFTSFPEIAPFQRYQPIVIGDTLKIWYAGESKYVREKGLVDFYQWNSGNSGGTIKLNLLDSQIVPEE